MLPGRDQGHYASDTVKRETLHCSRRQLRTGHPGVVILHGRNAARSDRSEMMSPTSMVIRFGLRDLMVGILAVGGLLGTFCLTPKGCYAVTMMLLPAAVSWHLIKNDWFSCWLAGATGTLAMFLFLTLAAVSPVGLGSFPGETLFWAGPSGFFMGFVVGLVSRVVRQAADRLMSEPVVMRGSRGVLAWVAIGYSIAVALALCVRFWHLS